MRPRKFVNRDLRLLVNAQNHAALVCMFGVRTFVVNTRLRYVRTFVAKRAGCNVRTFVQTNESAPRPDVCSGAGLNVFWRGV
jgi:hypothetical protein